MKDVLPFLSTLPGAAPVASFVSALPVAHPPGGPSPWSPTPPAAAPAVDTAALRAEACARGREEGLRETQALRDRLQRAIAELEAATAEVRTVRAEQIAEAATTVIDAWSGSAGGAARLVPVVRAWQERMTEPATLTVHPAHADALREAIGDAPLTVVADPTLPQDALRIRSATRELDHHWDQRLAELRAAIVHAMEVTS